MNKSGTERNSKPAARFSFKNLALWFACLLVSYGLWCYVRINESTGFDAVYQNIPVTLTHKDELGERKLALYSGEGNVISVKLSGKYSSLPKSHETDKITAYVDLDQVTTTGQMELEIKVKPPEGCQVVSQSRKTIFVDVDEQITQNLAVIPIYTNDKDLPEDCYFEYSMKRLTTNSVTVIGPKQEVVKVQSVNLNINLEGVDRTEPVNGEVELLDENGETFESTKVNYTPNTISVTIPVMKKQKVKVEPVFTDSFLNATNSTFTAEPSEVELTGDRDAMEKGTLLYPIEISEGLAFADGSRVYTGTASLVTGEDISIDQSEVQYTVTLDPNLTTREFSISSERITDDTPADVRDSLDYMLESKMIDVTLMGYPDILANIEEEDLELHLDMSSYKDSTFREVTADLKVKIPSLGKGAFVALGSYGIKVERKNG